MSRSHLNLLAILAVIMASMVISVRPAGSVAAVGPQGDQIIVVPIRWCVLDGTTAHLDPGAFGETSTDQVVLKRHARATDAVLLPGLKIMLASAFTASSRPVAHVPIIADPAPPGLHGQDALGDIVDPRDDPTELKKAVANCGAAWDALAEELDTTLVGPVALNIGRFVERSGEPVQLGGWSGYTSWSPESAHACVTPSGAATATGGFMAVVDLSVVQGLQSDTMPIDPLEVDARLVAHEFSHILYLGHGNGEDDDGDTYYDYWCDPNESADQPVPTVMHPDITLATDMVTARQLATARDLGLVYSGHLIDPPAALVSGATLSDQRADSVQDVDTESVDLTYVELAINESQESITLTQSLFGRVGEDETNEYLAFIDLDQNAETGGPPAELGFPTGFAGADVVTQVVVEPGRIVSATVWQAQDDGSFMDVTDQEAIEAQLVSPLGGESDPPTPIFDVVSIELPLGIIGEGINETVAIQVVARQMTGGQEFDVLPGENQPSDESVELRLVPPMFPVCGLTPDQAAAGDTVTIEAVGFESPGADVSIALGDQEIADAELDESGSLTAELVIPADAAPGLRLVTVGLTDSALSANCALQIGQANE